jgi:hypothetical protein
MSWLLFYSWDRVDKHDEAGPHRVIEATGVEIISNRKSPNMCYVKHGSIGRLRVDLANLRITDDFDMVRRWIMGAELDDALSKDLQEELATIKERKKKEQSRCS